MSVESFILKMRMPDVPDVDEMCDMLKLPGGAPSPPQDTFDLVAAMVLRGEIPHVRVKEDDFEADWRQPYRDVVDRLKTEHAYHVPFEVNLANMCYTVDVAKNIVWLVHSAVRALKSGPVAQMTARVKNDKKAKHLMSSLYVVSVIYIALRLQFDIDVERQEALQIV